MNFNRFGRTLAVTVALMLLATMAVAQLQTGNLYGTVKDDKGNPLPGVTVNLTGGGAPQMQVSNAQGEFRFLSLAPGAYKLNAELEGFSKIDYPNIVVNVGRNTSLELTMNAAVEETITVTTESPLLDTRRISTGATVAKTELEKIPTARDPWSVLNSTPGVQTDRINVGGNESGQQAVYNGPGSGQGQSIWSVDGVVITDMGALGSSPAYYDFDSFEEMQVTTGGSDSTIATGGVVLNMVTKRGTNEWRGSGRYLKTDKSWQSNSGFDKGKLGKDFDGAGVTTAQPSFGGNANRLIKVDDYGLELGGPIVKDRLWVWGSYARQKPELLTLTNVSDKTDLKTWNGKLNAQVTSSNSATLFALQSDKVKIGRNAGPTRPQETTWDQSKFGPSPTAFKAEDTQIFSSNFYLTGLWSIVNGGFQLVPEGGLTPTAYLDSGSVWHNTYAAYYTKRPQKQYKLDSSVFFNTGNLSHELKFGAGYRLAEVTSLSGWGGAGYVANADAFGAGQNVLVASRFRLPASKLEYKDAYVQDTLTVGNLTANIGLRYDTQGGELLGRTVGANPILPGVLPTVTVAGGDIGFEWKRLTPRLGVTYALGPERKTLLRASYARFADQLGTGTANQLNPLNGYSYAYFYTTNTGQPTVTPGQVIDLNGDGVIDANDVLFYSSAVNPTNGHLLQSNGVSSGFNAPLTDELLLSVEHALLPEFVIGFNLTYRKLTDLQQTDQLVFDGASSYSPGNLNSIGRRATRNDYALCGTAAAGVSCPTGILPNGQTYTIPWYVLKTGIYTRGGTFLYNSDAEQTYKGAAFTFNKRLANRWMLRGNITYADWYQSKVALTDPTEYRGGGSRVDDQVVIRSTGSGSKGDVFIGAKWSYSVGGLYQVAPDRPWGFNVAANLTGREGYSLAYWRQLRPPSSRYENGPAYAVAATSRPDSFRNDNLHVLDVRVEKELHFGDFGVTLGVDCFNITNEGTVLQRNTRLGQGSTNWVRETISPRVVRLGARLSWK